MVVSWAVRPFSVDAKTLAREDVGDRGQSVVGLVGGHVMDMRGLREIGRLIGGVTGHGMRLVPASEALIQRR